MTVDQVYRVNSEELLNRSFKYYYTVDTSAFSNDDFDIFVNSLEKSNRNSTKKFQKRNTRRISRACVKKLVDYPLTDSDVYENVSSGVSYMEVVDESCASVVTGRRQINFSGASSVLLDVSSSYECLSSIDSSQKQLQNTSLECLLNRNKSLKDIFRYFDEDVKIDDSSTTSLHRIGHGWQGENDKFLTYDDEKYDNQVYLYKKQQKSVDNMVNEFQRLKTSYLQQTLNDYNATRTSATVGRLDKNRIQFFENMCSSGDGLPNNTTEIAGNKLNNTHKSLVTSKMAPLVTIIDENEKNVSLGVKSLLTLDKVKIEQDLVDKLDPDPIQTPVIPVFNVNLKGSCDKEKSFNKEIFLLKKQASLNSTPVKYSPTPPPMLLNHSSPITPPQPPINWSTHPINKRQSCDHSTQTTPKKFQDTETNTSGLVPLSTPVKSGITGKNLSFTTFDASDIDDNTFQENYSCFTFDDAPFININDKSLLLSLENFLAIWDLSLIDMILALINENCNLTEQTEVVVRTNVKNVECTSLDLQWCHMCALAYESNELGAVMKLSLFDPNTNKDTDVKIIFCAIDTNQMHLLDEKLEIVTDDLLIYVAFLLKIENNTSQKSSSEAHQLRVQASLQRLNVPDWYKSYISSQSEGNNDSTFGSFLRKRHSDVGRWTGLGSKVATLGTQRSEKSSGLFNLSSQSHHGRTGLGRWSTSHLNPNQTSPDDVSTRDSFSRDVLSGSNQSACRTIKGSHRQPYLGWRSQERLAQTTVGLRTPAERLASSLLQQKQQQQQFPSSEIKDEIKEVTSAIVHYVNDQQNQTCTI